MAKKKRGDGEKKKQKAVHDPNKNHQAHAKDSAQVLKRAVQSSGLNGARIVAKRLDEQGRDGTATLAKLMAYHQEPMAGTNKLVWVAGSASWMREAMAADERKKLTDPASWRLTHEGLAQSEAEGLTNPGPWTPKATGASKRQSTYLATGRMAERALSRKMSRLGKKGRQKQLEMKKAQTQQPPTPPAQ